MLKFPDMKHDVPHMAHMAHMAHVGPGKTGRSRCASHSLCRTIAPAKR
jgi:hypothetical protein